MFHDLLCNFIHLPSRSTSESTSHATLSKLPPELLIPMFDHIIAFPRTISITKEPDSDPKSDVVLSLKRISTSFRDSIADWVRSRPQLVNSGFRGVGIYDPACTKFVLDFSTLGGITHGLYMDDENASHYQAIWNAGDGSFIQNVQHIEIDARWGCCEEQEGSRGRHLLLKPFLRLRKLQALKRVDVIVGERNWDRLKGGAEWWNCEWVHLWGHIFMWLKRCPVDEKCYCCGPLPIVMVGNGKTGVEEEWIGLRWYPIGLRSGAANIQTFHNTINFRVQTRRIFELGDLMQQGLYILYERLEILRRRSWKETFSWEHKSLETQLMSMRSVQTRQLRQLEARKEERTVDEIENEGMETRIVDERMWLEDQRKRLEMEREYAMDSDREDEDAKVWAAE